MIAKKIKNFAAIDQRRLIAGKERVENIFDKPVVLIVVVLELTALRRGGVALESPAGETAAGFIDILIDIAAGNLVIDRSESVQFHQFASIVFVRTRIGADVIIEIIKHQGMNRRL